MKKKERMVMNDAELSYTFFTILCHVFFGSLPFAYHIKKSILSAYSLLLLVAINIEMQSNGCQCDDAYLL